MGEPVYQTMGELVMTRDDLEERNNELEHLRQTVNDVVQAESRGEMDFRVS